MAQADRLPVQDTVQQAFALLWRYRDEWLRLALAPVVLSFLLAVFVFLTRNQGVGLIASFVNMAPLALFAVSWHRLVLLGPRAIAPGLALVWSARETRFFVRALLFTVGLSLVAAAPAFLFARMMQGSPSGALLLVAVALGLLLVAMRVGLAFPATALDRAYGFAQSWRDTAGCGLPLLGIVVLTGLPFALGVLLFHLLATSIGLARAAPYAMLFVEQAAGYLATAAMATAVSLAYRRLAGGPPAANLQV